MHSLISYSVVKIVIVVSDISVLLDTAAAHFQDDLLSRRSFSRHHTQIYSPRELFYLDEMCTPNRSISRTFEENKGTDPQL